jgi:hypothetical protein
MTAQTAAQTAAPSGSYQVTSAEGAETELQGLSGIIVPGFGPGNSLLNKLDQLVELYANGDYQGALAMSNTLANQVLTLRGKTINETESVAILSLLEDFDSKLRTLLSP